MDYWEHLVECFTAALGKGIGIALVREWSSSLKIMTRGKEKK